MSGVNIFGEPLQLNKNLTPQRGPAGVGLMLVSHCHSFRGSHSGAEGKCPLRLSGDLSH